MSLKFRLAFLYSLSVFIILLVSALSIFLFNEEFRKDEFIKRLVIEGKESAKIFFSVPDLTDSIIEDLDHNAANSLPRQRIYIYDTTFHLIYSTYKQETPSISPALFEQAKKDVSHIFTDNKGRECVLSYVSTKQKSGYVLTSAYDFFGKRKSENLKLILSLSVLGGLVLSGILAFFYVRHAMTPLEELKGQIEKIDEKNMKARILVGDKNNEVWQIAKKFNEMLDRLEQAFEQRKNFVQHASHELRTPLANMLSQTESALSKTLNEEDYRQILVSLKEEQQDLIALTNSLLTLSRYENIPVAPDWSTIRIDEVLYEVVDFAKEIWPKAVITVAFDTVPKTENELEVKGNESLIKSAMQNLVKNGLNYSSNQKVDVTITVEKTGVLISFENDGKQLTPEEQNRLFIPFFRGENAINKKGYGLGLSIVQRIVLVHNGTIAYQRIGSNANRFALFLPFNA